MKLVFISALFTAVLSMIASPSGATPESSALTGAITEAVDDQSADPGADLGPGCVEQGGVCRKSACRLGEVVGPVPCGHDLGCCLPAR